MVMAHNFGRPPAEIAREGGLGVQPMMPLGRSAIADSVFAPDMPPPMRRPMGVMPPPPMRRPMGMMPPPSPDYGLAPRLAWMRRLQDAASSVGLPERRTLPSVYNWHNRNSQLVSDFLRNPPWHRQGFGRPIQEAPLPRPSWMRQ